MGAWESYTFGNDAACDWAGEFTRKGELSFVEQTFNAVFEEGEEYLDSDEACRGLAACEVIARLKGNWGVQNPYSEGVDEWVQSHPQTPSDELVQQALAVIDRVRAENSELRELWEDAAEWVAAMDDLRQRVAN